MHIVELAYFLHRLSGGGEERKHILLISSETSILSMKGKIIVHIENRPIQMHVLGDSQNVES